MSDLDVIALSIGCTYCGAEPGERCRSVRGYSRPAGQRARYPHEARNRPIREAWRLGIHQGQQWVAQHVLRAQAGDADPQHVTWLTAALPKWAETGDLW